MRSKLSLLERVTKGITLAAMLVAPLSCAPATQTAQASTKETPVVVKEYKHSVGINLTQEPVDTQKRKVLGEVKDAAINESISMVLKEGAGAAAGPLGIAAGIIRGLPSDVTHPSYEHFVRTASTDWQKKITVYKNDKIILGVAYDPGFYPEPDYRGPHVLHGIEILVSRTQPGLPPREKDLITVLDKKEEMGDAPNFFVVREPYSIADLVGNNVFDKLVATKTYTFGETNPAIVTVRLKNSDKVKNIDGKTPKIVFVSTRDENPEIYTMNADGSEQTRLTHNTAQEAHPVWSPDGSKIAFISNRAGENEFDVYVMGSNGSEQTRLTRHRSRVQQSEPAWSPEGDKLAFTSLDHKVTEITPEGAPRARAYVINVDGTNLTQLNFNGWGGKLTWSTNGEWIGRVTDYGTIKEELHLIEVNENSSEVIYTDQFGSDNGIIMPTSQEWNLSGPTRLYDDGDNVFVEHYVKPGDGTWTSELPVQLTRSYYGSNKHPVWVSNDDLILFEKRSNRESRPGDPGICTMKPDGSDKINLTKSNGRNSDPDWYQPTSK